MSPVRSILLSVLAVTVAGAAAVDPARAQCPPLAGFDGPAGFGSGVLVKGDDNPSVLVDVTAAFPEGLGFFGATFSDVYININGNVTLGEPSAVFTPFPFPSTSGVRRIAIFFSDVDTRTDRGLDNNIYYHVDSAGGRLVITWLAVERYNVDASAGLDTFQMILSARPDLGPGDFDVEYRYQAVNWIAPAGSPPAQIGFDAGDGIAFASHPASMTAAVAELATTPSNHASDCATGSFAYYIRGSCGNDRVDAAAQEECDPLGSHPGCSSLCTVTPGYACTYVDGQPSACAAGCGNGVFDAAVEECDDGNQTPGDGCSNLCRVEPGATCDTSVEPSDCDNTCDDDGDCAGLSFCGDQGRCQPARPVAQVCTRDAMCTSGACADGVCCSATCDGGCGTCAAAGSVGTCTPVADGTASATCGDLLCDGVALDCPTGCAGDGDCTAASHCATGACVPDLSPGGACDRVGQCASGVCTDGVCCSATCDGACERCDLPGAQGTCTPLPWGTVEALCGDFTCDGESGQCPTSCAGDDGCVVDHFCDGQGACLPDLGPGAGCGRDAQCGARVCSAGVCCGTTCDRACETCVAEPGTCTARGDGTAAAACDPFLCDGVGGGCPTTCSGDGDCAGDHFCDGGACLPDRDAGEACDRDAVCALGTTCVDGVCCTSACDGACERCDAPGDEGACTPLPDGTFVVACGAYACDGASGACPGTCAGDDDCLADRSCDGTGACVPDGGAGAPCDRTAQCGTGTCADGVCCDSSCEGACERCDLAGSAGACTPVADGVFAATCGAYACDGASGACPTTCATDGDCAGDHHCEDGACVADRAVGSGCERTAQCVAGACVDDVCCTVPCDGPCGRCGLVSAGACGLFGDGTFVAACGAYACDGGAAACPTTCGDDGDCAASHFCDGGACVPDRLAAAGCERDAQCGSGFCTDGVCCNGRCDAACEACDLVGSKGVCTPVPDGTVANVCGGTLCDGVTGSCPTTCGTDADCAFSHYCKAGACVLDEPPGGACDRKAQCGEGHCVDAVCCFSPCDGACDRCDGASPGTCAPVADGTFVAACGAYACDGASAGCPATCAGDGDCQADHFCEAGACLADRAPGGACDRVAQCALGVCADGVCCSATCDGGCDRCDGATPGTCAPLPDGAPGQGCGAYLCGGAAACPTACESDVDCVADHFCEAGACLPDRATGQACDRVGQCGSGHCADGVCCSATCDGACDRCDGAEPGTCAPIPDGLFVAACEPYLCGGAAACPTRCVTNADCVEDHFCDDGACAPDAAPGVACEDDAMCATGTCSDGVCCDWPCEGACERCDLPSTPGTCTLVSDGLFETACGVYACDGVSGACPTACASDGDCVPDHFCDGQGSCRPDLAAGLACARASQCLSAACADGVCCSATCDGACDRCDLPDHVGTCTSVGDGVSVRACEPYLCGGGSACPTACEADLDCATGFVCEAKACVAVAADGAPCGRDARCASGHCVVGLCCSATCDGPCEACDLDGLEGQCLPRVAGTAIARCGDYLCDGLVSACPTACETDLACAEGTWCGEASCLPTLADDAACARDAMCTSGFCDEARCVTLTIDQPLDGAITNDATPEIRGRAPPGTTVVVTIGASTAEVVAGEDGVWVFVPEGLLSDGPVTIVAALASGAEVEIDITIDTTNPTIVILAPLAGTIRAESSVSVSGTTEPDLHVVIVLGDVTREADASATGAWGVGFDGLADGPHTATATAIDLAGNRGEASVTFTVDSLAPSITITSPLEGALSNVPDVVIAGRGKPSSSLTLLHDGQTFAGAVDAAGDWSITLEDVADGTWTDKVTITDAAERRADDEVTYTIDTVPPTLAITSPEADAILIDPRPTVTGTSEPGASLEVRLDGAVLTSVEVGADGAWTVTPPEALTLGAHTASVSARDLAGNITEVTRSFTVDQSRIHLVGGSSCAGGGALAGLALALASLALLRARARRRAGRGGDR